MIRTTSGATSLKSRLLLSHAFILIASLVLLAPSQAAMIIEAGMVGDVVDITDQGTMAVDPETGTMFWFSTDDLVGNGWMIPINAGGLSVASNPDPFINTGFTFLNTSGGTANFVLSVSNTSADEIPAPVISGETNYDLTDANNNGATLDQSGTGESLYNAFFGGDGDVRDLVPPDGDAALPVNANGVNIGQISGAYSNEAIGSGLSIGEAFGIRHEFRLSSFDRVTVQSTFIVEVPEPATIALAAFGVIGLLACRRYR